MLQRHNLGMKWLVRCLAAAGLMSTAGVASAQSSITLYGIVDGSLLYTNHTMNTLTGQNEGHQFSFTDSGMSGSNFGMRGVEDLGGGLRAEFALESGFSVANGQFGNSNGNFFGRQAWIGMDSPYGTVKAGMQYSPFFLSLYATDPRGMSYFGSGLVTALNNVYVTSIFNSNAITYTSPEIAGFEAAGLFALGGTAGDFQAGRQYSASLRYHIGGLMLTGALYSGNAGGSAASTPVPSTVEFVGRTIGATYRFPNSLALFASYALYKVAQSFDNSVYSGGLSYMIAPYLDVEAGVWYTRDGNDSSNHSLLASSGLQFFLSKRTTLYGQVGYVNNHGLMHTGLSANNALFEVTGSTVAASIGLRHLF
jgi:predicted porin